MPNCLICKSKSSVVNSGLKTTEDNFRLGKFVLFYCNDCKLGFTQPIPNTSYYELHPDNQTQNHLIRLFLSVLTDFRVKRIKKLIKKPLNKCTVLDVGAGACAFANKLAKYQARVTVIEPNEKNIIFADKRIKFISSFFDKNIFSGTDIKEKSFDVITMWHSLEHLPAPKDAMKLISKLLKPGGIVLISVPNIVSLQARIGGNHWVYLDIPHHHFHFSLNGLDRIFSSFSRIKNYTFSIEYDPFGWQQTLLNLFSASHNYYYNKTKRGNMDQSYLKYPHFTRIVTRFQYLLLPITSIFTLVSYLFNSPSCIEVVYKLKLDK